MTNDGQNEMVEVKPHGNLVPAEDGELISDNSGGPVPTKGPTSHGKKGRVDLKPEPVDLILNNLVIPSAPDG